MSMDPLKRNLYGGRLASSLFLRSAPELLTSYSMQDDFSAAMNRSASRSGSSSTFTTLARKFAALLLSPKMAKGSRPDPLVLSNRCTLHPVMPAKEDSYTPSGPT